MQPIIDLPEGPILSWMVGLFFAAVLGISYLLPSFAHQHKQSTPNENSYMPWVVLLCFFLFLFSSHHVDFSKTSIDLKLHSILSWLVFGTVLWALYDILSVIIKKFGIEIYTPYIGFNIALIFLIGDRLLALTTFIMGLSGIPLRTSFNVILYSCIAWTMLRLNKHFFSFPKLSFKTFKLDKFLALLPLFFIIIYLVCMWHFNNYRQVVSWDNYSHWLIIPHEMLTANTAAGLYEFSRSVAPGYPPQQLTDGAFLLHLWGNSNFSDTLLNSYNPVLLTIGLLVCKDITHKFNMSHIMTVGVVIMSIAVIAYLPSIYRLSFYGDARIAIVFLTLISSLLFIEDHTSYKSAFMFALISACAFTLKPYAWPFAFTTIIVLFLFRFNIKYFIAFFAFISVFFLVETSLYQLFVPDSQIIDRPGIGGRIGTTLVKTLEFNFDNVKEAFTFRAPNIPTLITLLITAFVNCLFFIFTKNESIRKILIASTFLIVGMISLMVIITQLTPAYGNSLERYLKNTTFILIMCSIIWLGIITSKISKNTVWLNPIIGIVLIIGSSFALFKSPTKNGFEWVLKRQKYLSLFPEDKLLKSSLVKDAHALDAKSKTRILSFPQKTRLAVFRENYLMARTTPFVSIYTKGGFRDNTRLLLESHKLTGVESWLEKTNIGYLKVYEEQVIFGNSIAPGFYSRDEFLQKINIK